MKKSGLFAIIGALVILVLAQTNPSLEEHRAAFRSRFMERINNTIDDTVKKDSGLGKLGSSLGSALIDKMVDVMITRDSYVLFSLTKVKFDGENKTVGVGILGNVYVTSESDSKFSL
jgi:hypothetical protein